MEVDYEYLVNSEQFLLHLIIVSMLEANKSPRDIYKYLTFKNQGKRVRKLMLN